MNQEKETAAWTLDPKAVMTRVTATACFVAGAWYFGIQPLSASVSQKRAEIEGMRESLISESEALRRGGDQDRVFEVASKFASDLMLWTRTSSDSRGLYDRLRRMAATAKVKIVGIEPKGSSVISAPAGPKPEGFKALDIRASGLTIIVTGSFTDVATFIDSLDGSIGASRVFSVRLTPQDSAGKSIQAMIETTHYSINTPLEDMFAPGAVER
jgi:hypothetical protein